MFEDNTDEFIQKVKNRINDNMTELTEEYQEDVKNTLDVPPQRTGRVYYDIKGKDKHIASDSGEPPAPLTRDLINSIDTDIVGHKRGNWISYVYSDLMYAFYLALGTDKIDERPYWRPTLSDNKEKYAEIATRGFVRRH